MEYIVYSFISLLRCGFEGGFSVSTRDEVTQQKNGSQLGCHYLTVRKSMVTATDNRKDMG